ncbi:MAG: GIY-YIG nuclease family protein [Candidatus Aminicenantes bacterium]|nr:MAG: GIY-YIG nuclease family protein [Candidatus Aminicenantes bacterium]HDJ22401.1 GIY-YIG nuclease family protein [Candidatus Aminicenantes bacterium]
MINASASEVSTSSFPQQGLYLLVVHLPTAASLRVGKKRIINFPAGYYGYVGRAKKNLRARLKRYLSPYRQKHWHIDYLLDQAVIHNIWTSQDEKLISLEKEECRLAAAMRHHFPCQPPQLTGLGASDCRCPGHFIFLGHNLPQINLVLTQLQLMRRKINGI